MLATADYNVGPWWRPTGINQKVVDLVVTHLRHHREQETQDNFLRMLQALKKEAAGKAKKMLQPLARDITEANLVINGIEDEVLDKKALSRATGVHWPQGTFDNLDQQRKRAIEWRDAIQRRYDSVFRDVNSPLQELVDASDSLNRQFEQAQIPMRGGRRGRSRSMRAVRRGASRRRGRSSGSRTR
jgi:hypothetical protein